MPISLALVDDHPTLLRGIESLLSEDPRYLVVGTGGRAEDAVRLAEEASPDVVILDLSMPGDVYEAIEKITQKALAKVLVFTAYDDVNLAMRALDAGAQGFVLKGRPTTDLNDAIESVLAGEIFVSPDFAKKLMGGFRHRSRREKGLKEAKLSARERQLVECLLQAHSNKEIARTLNLSEKTVKHYMTNLMNKLGVRSRVEVVLTVQARLGGQEARMLETSDPAR
jgi:two-component system, NarL family, nitrate/nitrite response regulator NarL